MRHLFVPACLCLMTLPGATGPDAILSLQSFSGITAVAKMPDAGATNGGITTRDKLQSRPDSIDSELPLDDNAAKAESADLTPIVRPPLPPVEKPVVVRTREEICDVLTKAAHNNDVPVPFFIQLLFQESRFKPDAVSSAGAQGIAQFMPQTAASVGLDNPFDPLQAIPAAARLLRGLAQQFGNLGLAAAAYNAGPKRIQDWLAKKDKLPQETQGYVKTITGRAPETWTVATAGTPAQKLPRRAPCQEAAGLLAWNGPEQIPLPLAAPAKAAPLKPARNTMIAARAHGAAHAKASNHTVTVAAAAPAKSAAKSPAKPVHPSAIKAATAQLAAAKHKHAHKNETVAQN
jgi:hypothetical protein